MKNKEGRAEWLSKERNTALIYWRNPEEWAAVIAEWVEETAQKGVVLTVYELTEGDLSASQGKLGFHAAFFRRGKCVANFWLLWFAF
jgi:ESCRT-II complex subunit